MKNTITACPTLCNPEALNTVAELRAELHRANEKILFACEQAHELAVRHNHMLEWCTVIATHHELGNRDQVILCLDNVVATKNRKF
jgi:hypothetical protein